MFLFNHSSQADFFIDDVITQGACNFLARFLVGVIMFPFQLVRRVVWFFRKGAQAREHLFTWMDGRMAASTRGCLLAYPQGHRYPDLSKGQGRELRTGMIEWAYTRGRPVQVCLAFGREQVLAEKRLEVSYGETVTYWIGPVISPAGKTWPQFCEEVVAFFLAELDRRLEQDQQFRAGAAVGRYLEGLPPYLNSGKRD